MQTSGRRAPPILESDRLFTLDGLHGLAAVYVLAGHARWPLSDNEGWASCAAEKTWAHGALALATAGLEYSHQVVVLFVLLSGYVIHRRYALGIANSSEGARFRPGRFLAGRARRLYPPLLAALALTWTWRSWAGTSSWTRRAPPPAC